MPLSAAEVLAGGPLTACGLGTGPAWGKAAARPVGSRGKPAALAPAQRPEQTRAEPPQDLAASPASALVGLQKGQMEPVSLPLPAPPGCARMPVFLIPSVNAVLGRRVCRTSRWSSTAVSRPSSISTSYAASCRLDAIQRTTVTRC